MAYLGRDTGQGLRFVDLSLGSRCVMFEVFGWKSDNRTDYEWELVQELDYQEALEELTQHYMH